MADQRGYRLTEVAAPSESQDVLAQDNSDPLVGQVIDGRYRVESRLGEGGMGVVYRASHVTLGKPLAMKVLRPEVSRNEEIVARFKQEAQSASAIGNQHIIDISDFGSLKDGSTYFVMEFLKGHSLTDALEEVRFTEERTVHVGMQLCRALGAAHERGIVHRDMKPDNVQLIERGGDKDFVKVLDFGIAKVGGTSSKLTQAGQVFGTPHYMSPEQCSGSDVDQRTDIYAVGVILYEMGTGQVPFDADNLMGILTKHLYETPPVPHELPPPVDISPGLESVILKCLQKKPEVRYQTMAELLTDLQALEAGATPSAVADQLERQSHTQSRLTGQSSQATTSRVTLGVGDANIPANSKLPLLLGASLAAILVGGGVYALLSGDSSEQAEAKVAAAAPPPAPEKPKVEEEPAKQEEAPPAQIQLTSVPKGAEVYKDKALLGKTPLVAFKPTGKDSLRLTLKLKGYESREIEVLALSPDELSVDLTKIEEKAASTANAPSKATKRSAKPRTKPRQTKPANKPASRPNRPSRGQSEVLDPWG